MVSMLSVRYVPKEQKQSQCNDQTNTQIKRTVLELDYHMPDKVRGSRNGQQKVNAIHRPV